MNDLQRITLCPVCGQAGDALLTLHFAPKLNLPVRLDIRCCAADDFAYAAPLLERAYEEYYHTVVNDYIHAEAEAADDLPVARQEAQLFANIPEPAWAGRRVLDFGCGQAHLLRRLARRIPGADFTGFDTNPTAAGRLAPNLLVTADPAALQGPYDILILSHVLEHLASFSCLDWLVTLTAENAVIYVEVPDALRYEAFTRRSFLYYFDRIHINHFSAVSLRRLFAPLGFHEIARISYDFPYSDNLPYPALGLFLRRGDCPKGPPEKALRPALERYLERERARAGTIASPFAATGTLLVWGGGDNFCRQLTNGGPLSFAQEIILLDRVPKTVSIDGKLYKSIPPEEGLRLYQGAVVITVTEASTAITRQIQELDPGRRVFLL